MKFWHITVLKGYTTVFGPHKCLTVQEANELLKKKKEEYPAPEYQVFKENF